MTKRQRVSRVVYAIFVLAVAAFTLSSIAQVARRVFGPEGDASGETAGLPTVGPDCAAALATEIDGIEQARLAASTERDEEGAKSRFVRERHAGDGTRACSADPQGTEALAALARLERAAVAHAVREARELSPVRQAAQSFIRGHKR